MIPHAALTLNEVDRCERASEYFTLYRIGASGKSVGMYDRHGDTAMSNLVSRTIHLIRHRRAKSWARPEPNNIGRQVEAECQ